MERIFPVLVVLWAKWHYPIFATSREDFRHTADRTNPCVNLMFTKFRLDRIW